MCLRLPFDIQLGYLVFLGLMAGCVCDAVVMASALGLPNCVFSAPSPLLVRDEREFVDKLARSAAARWRFDMEEKSEPLMLCGAPTETDLGDMRTRCVDGVGRARERAPWGLAASSSTPTRGTAFAERRRRLRSVVDARAVPGPPPARGFPGKVILRKLTGVPKLPRRASLLAGRGTADLAATSNSSPCARARPRPPCRAAPS